MHNTACYAGDSRITSVYPLKRRSVVFLVEDSYMDDILTSHTFKRLDKCTKRVEEIPKAGGFFFKPWVQSGKSGKQRHLLEHH